MDKIQKRTILTKGQCLSLIGPSFRQAKDLRQCSLLLYNNQYYSTSYSLYVLSLEEIGKALLCIGGNIGLLEVRKEHIHDHLIKQKVIIIFSMINRLMGLHEELLIIIENMNKEFQISDLPEDIQNDMFRIVKFLISAKELKEAGFYIDINGNGEIVIPRNNKEELEFPSFYFDDGFISGIEKKIMMISDEFKTFFDDLMDPELLFDMDIDDENSKERIIQWLSMVRNLFPIPTRRASRVRELKYSPNDWLCRHNTA